MSEYLPQIALVLLLVLINAALAGTELALVSLREGQLQRLETRSGTGAVLAGLAREPNRFLATIQIGITLAGFLASAAAASCVNRAIATWAPAASPSLAAPTPRANQVTPSGHGYLSHASVPGMREQVPSMKATRRIAGTPSRLRKRRHDGAALG